MLKPIHRVACSPALRACRQLQEHLLAWLCDPAVGEADVTKANLQQLQTLIPIEADWLWAFLEKSEGKRALLERAQLLAGMSPAEKLALHSWGKSVTALAEQFQPNPAAWQQGQPAIPVDAWQAFKQLMEAFYTKGLASGLPYLVNGTPAGSGGVNRSGFLNEFRNEHRPHPDAIDLCVFCGGELGDTPEIDHWISKGQYPLLSVCQDNLVPICHDCNSKANKGEKPVHTAGCFDDWFHPYLRSGDGKVRVDYRLETLGVTCAAVHQSDVAKVRNLDGLLNLSTRWAKRFKAEYRIQQDDLRRIAKKKKQLQQGAVSRIEIQNHLQEAQSKLSPERPWYEVHCALFAALLHQSRLDAWQTELEGAT